MYEIDRWGQGYFSIGANGRDFGKVSRGFDFVENVTTGTRIFAGDIVGLFRDDESAG